MLLLLVTLAFFSYLAGASIFACEIAAMFFQIDTRHPCEGYGWHLFLLGLIFQLLGTM